MEENSYPEGSPTHGSSSRSRCKQRKHSRSRRKSQSDEKEERRVVPQDTGRQLHQQAEAEIGTGLKLVQRKSNLLAQVAALTKTDEAVKVEDEARSRSKVNKLRDLQNGNEGLQSEVDEENVHNQKLLKRIEGLEDALRLSRSNEDIVRLQAELENLTEEKGVLEDGIVTLQKQIPLLLNHEEKLGGLLKEQQRVLQSFETKIHEVRILREAFEDDTRRHGELPQLPLHDESLEIYSQIEQRIAPSHILLGTWERSKRQGGKRSRKR
ncbi:hypothetical protein MPTK1_1g13980 [Marchantia polymorpha subsp. ruderalis]|uniref:Uncharacterized protein n=2 Tax=Marchantia polymorpha TaxID=3197 RepID=A0AAF6APX4_MARPO|nr:hypothetical protein MARPO_0019s0168 [Marchantia polymorpha]BBM98494.1 hypothetical protein Mp_1g13980 [Marchantia polymorpha subsp. ruderalis]|eukprot:PTQ44764.1 hypothetical protein MARPO_0019s0168 [Marchantia polymorpha]